MNLSRIPLLMALVLSYGLDAAAALPKTDPKVPRKRSHSTLLMNSKMSIHVSGLAKRNSKTLRAVYNGKDEVGRLYRKTLEAYLGASRPPGHTKWLKDATDGQRQGYWRLPTVAVMHYAITGNKDSYQKSTWFYERIFSPRALGRHRQW